MFNAKIYRFVCLFVIFVVCLVLFIDLFFGRFISCMSRIKIRTLTLDIIRQRELQPMTSRGESDF